MSVYIYLHGIAVSSTIRLGPHLVLGPARCPLVRHWVTAWAQDAVEEGVFLIFLPTVTSEFCIDATPDEAGAIRTWNTMWDAILLGAIEHREVSFNFQSDVSSANLSEESRVRVMNRAFRGMTHSDSQVITEAEVSWLETHFERGQKLVALDPFRNAVHVMWSYRWHTFARARLALIWSGVEGLFGVDGELVFRISLYISRFLEPTDDARRLALFESVKKLYKMRSAAVHGAKMKGDALSSVDDSAQLLQRLVRRCVETGRLPEPGLLAP